MKLLNQILRILFLLLFVNACASSSTNPPTSETSNSITNFTSFTPRTPILFSKDAGANWENLNTNLPSELEVAYMSSLGNELVIGTERHGLWISHNNKLTWKQIDKHFPNKKISSLHVADNEIYAGVFEEGIFKSKDNGKTWISLNDNLPDLKVRDIYKLKNELLIATDTGIFKSKNNQRSWFQVFKGGQISIFCKKNNNILAGTVNGVLISKGNNLGEKWEWIHQHESINNLAVLDDYIFAMYIYNDVLISNDEGKHWNKTDYKPRKNSYVYDAVQVGKYFIMSNNYGIHRSENQGETWQNIFPINDFFFSDFVVEEDIIYAGTRKQ